MKRIILYIVISVFALNCVCAQDNYVTRGKYFTYSATYETITGIGLTTDTADYTRGKHEGSVHFSNEYLNEVFYPLLKKVLSEKQLSQLSDSRFSTLITFTNQGEVKLVRFSVYTEKKDLYSEDDLYRLYKAIKNTKLDMTKGNVDWMYLDEHGNYDFARLSLQLFRLKENKSSPDK